MTDQPRIQQVDLITMDFRTGAVTFVRSDAVQASTVLSLPVAGRDTGLARLRWMRSLNVVIAETTKGDQVGFELPSYEPADHLDGRIVVYLDQNQWSAVANALHAPERVRHRRDRDAAHRLVEWVRDRRVVLPLSGGHHVETSEWSDDGRRYALGLTMLGLSHGWQMRNPIRVRRNEVYGSLRARFQLPAASRDELVFTLEPDVTSVTSLYTQPDTNLPPDYEHALKVLTCASSLIDVILDPDRIEPGVPSEWVAAQQRFSDWLDGQATATKMQKQRLVDAFLLRDIEAELAEEAALVAADREQFDAWLREFIRNVDHDAPSIALFRIALRQRHLTVGTRWTINDLTDMVYLSCATAYADVVVAERHMGAIMRQGVRQVNGSAHVVQTLRDAAAVIETIVGTEPGSPDEVTVREERQLGLARLEPHGSRRCPVSRSDDAASPERSRRASTALSKARVAIAAAIGAAVGLISVTHESHCT